MKALDKIVDWAYLVIVPALVILIAMVLFATAHTIVETVSRPQRCCECPVERP